MVMAAAVADWRPRQLSDSKMKKGDAEELELELVRNPDILAEIGALPGECTVVGFAAESADLEASAIGKMQVKVCDLIVANNLGVPGIGPDAEDNEGGCSGSGSVVDLKSRRPRSRWLPTD